MKNTPSIDKKIIELRAKFIDFEEERNDCVICGHDHKTGNEQPELLEHFLQEALEQQKSELLERIEGLKEDECLKHGNKYQDGTCDICLVLLEVNSALDKVIEIIEDE